MSEFRVLSSIVLTVTILTQIHVNVKHNSNITTYDTAQRQLRTLLLFVLEQSVSLDRVSSADLASSISHSTPCAVVHEHSTQASR